VPGATAGSEIPVEKTGGNMLQYCLGSNMETVGRDFDSCLAVILRENKGYCPGDVDGPTNHGITQAVYSTWRREQRLADKDIWTISFQEVESIYRKNFWIPSHAMDCPAPLNLLVFKCAIESGPRWAVKTIQHSLGLPRNGNYSQNTRTAVENCRGHEVAVRFLEARIVHYQDLCKKDPGHQPQLSIKLMQLENFLHTLRHPYEPNPATSGVDQTENARDFGKSLLPVTRVQAKSSPVPTR